MSEDYIVRNCAPTLAGIKTGSIFTCPYTSREVLLDSLRDMNQRLRHKGIRIIPLRFSENRALIYLYRPKKLSEDLSHCIAEDLLRKSGYCTGNCEKCIAQLIKKLQMQKDFPHEIGLFLGYPVEDVQGFIDNGSQCCKCVGCWKVYGDEESAKKKFAQYKKCTRLYCEQWAKGKAIERLAVAG